MTFDQHGYLVRLEWGPGGVATLAPSCSVLVVVDVLSFSTAVDVSVGRGASVLPLRWPHHGEVPAGTIMAGGRSSGGWSLSPASLLDLPAGARLALPSPNGAALSAAAAQAGATVLAGCLRNAAAVAAAALALAALATPGTGPPPTPDAVATAALDPAAPAAAGAGPLPRSDAAPPSPTPGGSPDAAGAIGLVAAGERWPDGTLRPAVEDLLGAGAIVAELMRCAPVSGDECYGTYRHSRASPEAMAAADAFAAARRRGLADALFGSSSGRELTARGFAADVELAAQYGISGVAPVLRDGEYRA